MQSTHSLPVIEALDSFPVCQLRGWRLYRTLPKCCPLRRRDALAAITAIQNHAWKLLAGHDPAGQRELDRAQICLDCHGRTAKSAAMLDLRKAAWSEAEPKPKSEAGHYQKYSYCPPDPERAACAAPA